jgi:hypothetical protein
VEGGGRGWIKGGKEERNGKERERGEEGKSKREGQVVENSSLL